MLFRRAVLCLLLGVFTFFPFFYGTLQVNNYNIYQDYTAATVLLEPLATQQQKRQPHVGTGTRRADEGCPVFFC